MRLVIFLKGIGNLRIVGQPVNRAGEVITMFTIIKNLYESEKHYWVGCGLPYGDEDPIFCLKQKKWDIDTVIDGVIKTGLFTAPQIKALLEAHGPFGEAYALCLQVQADHWVKNQSWDEESEGDIIDDLAKVAEVAPEAAVYNFWFPSWRAVLSVFEDMILGECYEHFFETLK